MPICLHVTSSPSSPLLSAALILPPSVLPIFSAFSWQVVSCCRGNTTGRPAAFTLGTGILPRAVGIQTHRGVWQVSALRKPPRLLCLLRKSAVISQFQRAPPSVYDDSYSDIRQTRLHSPLPCYAGCCFHAQTGFVITSPGHRNAISMTK